MDHPVWQQQTMFLSIFVSQKLDNPKVKKDVPISSQGRPWITVSDENVCDSPRDLYILTCLLLRTWFSPPAPLSSAAASLLVHWSLLSQGWASLLPQQPVSSHLEPPDNMVHFHCPLLNSYSEHWNRSFSLSSWSLLFHLPLLGTYSKTNWAQVS